MILKIAQIRLNKGNGLWVMGWGRIKTGRCQPLTYNHKPVDYAMPPNMPDSIYREKYISTVIPANAGIQKPEIRQGVFRRFALDAG
jgi:hypothetical protein